MSMQPIRLTVFAAAQCCYVTDSNESLTHSIRGNVVNHIRSNEVVMNLLSILKIEEGHACLMNRNMTFSTFCHFHWEECIGKPQGQ